MKNLITRQIAILMSIVIFFTSIMIVVIGVLLSEGLFADIKHKELVSDVSVLTQIASIYEEGKLDEALYEEIIEKASQKSDVIYMITNNYGEIKYDTKNALTPNEKKDVASFSKVLIEENGQDHQLFKASNKTYLLSGNVIVVDEQTVGAVVVYVDMIELEARKKEFFQSLILTVVIIIPITIGLSYLVLMRIIRPIRNVAAVARSIIKGDFAVRADESLKGEIGLLGKSINRLSINIYQNISQLFIEKNRLQQVLNSLKDGMISIDEYNNITHYNDIFLEMFQLDEDISGESLNNIEILNKDLFNVNQQLEDKNSIILRGLHDDLILKIVIAPITDEKNESAGAVILFSDVTELEKLEMMRRDYVANVSHELRSPLTSIRGLIEPLMDKIVTNEDDVQRYYKIIYQESLRLSRLVDDIMELSRLQTHEAVIEKRAFDLNLVIEMVEERYRLSNERINLIYNKVELPNVFSNYDRLEQILVILLDNAYKFTPEGGSIEIITELRTTDVQITVKDTGVGISEEDLPFVFNRFYKSDKSRTKKGTGLGLSIAKEILQILNERISVRSIKGEGSSFEFTVGIVTDKTII